MSPPLSRRTLLVAGIAAPLAPGPAYADTTSVDLAAAVAAPTVLHENGAWCWFADPRAVRHKGRFDRTYVGYVDNVGNIIVSTYDHTTSERTTSVLRAGFAVDDHNAPAILVRPNGSLLVFWSAHAGPTMFYRRSLRPEDASAWGPVQTVATNSAGSSGYTYANPVQLASEGNKIYLFWRGGNFNPTFSTANDQVGWSPAKTLINVPGQRPYLKVAANNVDAIHFAFTDAHPRGTTTSIYHMVYRAGQLYRSDGTHIAALSSAPITPAQATRVYNGPAAGVASWVHDIALDSSGHPVITYATFPTQGDHRYNYARWTGTRWFTKELTRAGGSISTDPVEYQYTAGITLDHHDPSMVYLSRPVAGIHEIERWTTSDNGTTWKSAAVTAGSTQPNVRPITPRGGQGTGPMGVIWMAGPYGTYTTFRTRIMRSGVDAGNAAPNAAYSASPRTGAAPLKVVFDGGQSTSPTGPISTWSWDFGDGTTGTGVTISHTYARAGTYPVTLRVSDERGPRDALVKEVIVTAP